MQRGCSSLLTLIAAAGEELDFVSDLISGVVHLEGGVFDAVLVGEEFFQVAAPGMAVLVVADEHVGREGGEAAGYGPDVQVVDFLDAGDAGHLTADLGGIDAGRGLFEQDVDRVAQELPGASQDEQADEHADQGVGVAPAGENDDGGGDYGPCGAEHIGKHMPQNALEVEAIAPGAREHQSAYEVYDEPHHGYDQHPAAEDLGRLRCAPVSFDKDPDGDRDQRDPVGEGGQDLGPFVAEAPVGGGG